MRRTNVIIFSSGVSEKRGLVQWLKDELEKNAVFAGEICSTMQSVRII